MPEFDPEQWKEVVRLFELGLELPPEQRRQFLERECPDESVRREVASLLENSGASLPAADEAIATMAAEIVRELDPDQRLVGTRLGPYRVEAILGHGGMGAVYRAERDDAEFRQRVAIKLVRAAASSPATLVRFKQERQILARLSHPNIARLLDGGSTPEGVPYLVMEFIEGRPITDWCTQRSLKIEDRLRLFVHVCEGVEHAHHSLIVHRDLKPANILVTREGTPKLLDFGIAKLLDATSDSGAVTKTGLPLMTPDYASPEQVRGDPVTPAVDVYALGLILYELLSGEKAQKMPDYSPGTIARVVCQTQPAPPASLRPQLAGDLDNIIRMALRKEPERRYHSAGALGSDIQRHLEKRPVMARPDTLTYRWAKFVRRNQVAVAAGLVVLVLGAGLAFSVAALRRPDKRGPRVLQVRPLTHSGQIAVTKGVVTDGARVFFVERHGGIWSMNQVPVDGGEALPIQLPVELLRPEILDISPDRSSLLVGADDSDESIRSERPLWAVPLSGASPRRLGDVLGHSAAWTLDGRHVIVARGDALYRVNRDGTDSRKLVDLPGSAISLHRAPAAPPDTLRFCLRYPAGRPLTLWEVTAGAEPRPLLRGWSAATGFPDGESTGAWLSAGTYYVFESRHNKLTSVWAMREKGGFLGTLDRSPIQIYSTPMEASVLAAKPDGKQVYVGLGQVLFELMRFDARRRQFMPYLPGTAGRWVSYSKDKAWVAYVNYPEGSSMAGNSAGGSLWRSRPDGSQAVRLTAPSLMVTAPRWSPDGARIAAAGTETGRPDTAYVIPSASGPAQPVPASTFILGTPNWSPDGKSLLFSVDPPAGNPLAPGIYIVDLATGKPRFLPGSDNLFYPTWSQDGRYVVAHRARTEVMLYDFRTGRWTFLTRGIGLGLLYFSGDSRYVYYQNAFGGEEQPIFRVHLLTRKVEQMMGMKQIPQSNVTAYLMAGLEPGDVLVASVFRSNADIFSLDLEIP